MRTWILLFVLVAMLVFPEILRLGISIAQDDGRRGRFRLRTWRFLTLAFLTGLTLATAGCSSSSLSSLGSSLGLGSAPAPLKALSEASLSDGCSVIVKQGDIGAWALQQASCLGLAAGQKMCGNVLGGNPVDVKLLPALDAVLAIEAAAAGAPPAVDPVLNGLSSAAVSAANVQATDWCEKQGYSAAGSPAATKSA